MKRGTLVSVAEPRTAQHLIDCGMLSSSIEVQLRPTDVLEFYGSGFGKMTLRARPQDVESLISRAVPVELRTYAHRTEFLLELPKCKVIEHEA